MTVAHMTPEQLVEHAFALFAPDEADWKRYKARRDGLLSLIQSYGAAQAAAERMRINRMLHEHVKSRAQYSPDDATARGRYLEACDIAEMVREQE